LGSFQPPVGRTCNKGCHICKLGVKYIKTGLIFALDDESLTMALSLENHRYRFSFFQDSSTWSLIAATPAAPSILNARVQVVYRRGGAVFDPLTFAAWEISSEPEPDSTPPREVRQISLKAGPDPNGIFCRLDFALPSDGPLFFWRMGLENRCSHPIQVERIELLRAGLFPDSRQTGKAPASRLQGLSGQTAFFSNGWQSWNYTGVFGAQEKFKRTRLGPFTAPMRVNSGTPQPKEAGHFASDMFGILGDRASRTGILAGFLSQKAHFGSLEAWLRPSEPGLRLWANGDQTRLDPGRTMLTDWACLYVLPLDDPDPLKPYLEAVAHQHGIRDRLPPSQFGSPDGAQAAIPVGWCSWYQFFTHVTAEDVQRNLQSAADLDRQLPLALIQIDDGFEARVGDWFEFLPTFPNGMAALAAEIRQAGFTPGLWLAPFIVDPRSRLAHEHPEWILHGRFNRPVNAGFNLWGTIATALDLTRPEALDYTCQVVERAVQQWGYPYLKLDFLYAGALPGRRQDPTRTRAQILRQGLCALRQAAGEETTILGCGCPLGSAIGLFSPMRIGPDVSVDWEPVFMGRRAFVKQEPDYPSARNAIHNILTRAPLHRRWWINDPDPLLLRDDTHLSLAELQSLATAIALTGGSCLFSDDLARLTPGRLRIAQALLPVIGLRPQIPDWFDAATPARLRLDLENASGKWHLLALFNWEDQPADLTLRLADFGLAEIAPAWGHEFWTDAIHSIESGTLNGGLVPQHGVYLLAVRTRQPNLPQYLGSDLHISQGLEITQWQPDPHGLAFSLERPVSERGSLYLNLPAEPEEALLNGAPLDWERPAEGCYRFGVAFDRQASIRIDW
jgi:alpha-galactosidase